MYIVTIVESVRNWQMFENHLNILGRNSVSAMGLLGWPRAGSDGDGCRVDCGGLRTEGAAKCQEAVGTLGIPPVVSVAPLSPERL